MSTLWMFPTGSDRMVLAGEDGFDGSNVCSDVEADDGSSLAGSSLMTASVTACTCTCTCTVKDGMMDCLFLGDLLCVVARTT